MQKLDPEYLQYKTYYERRIKMRNNNFTAISTYNQKQQLLLKRISKIAAIQKFISKLKTENRNAEALLIEMDTLNLSKYLQEVANNIATSVTQKQVELLAEMASKLTQFYENFSHILIKQLKKQFESVLASNDQNKIQLKAILHLATQLFVCAFPLPYKDISDFIKKIFRAGTPINKELLTQLQKKQRIYCFNSDVYAMFVTNYGQMFCNRSSKNIKKWAKQGYQLKKFPQIIPVKTKEQITKFFEKYIKEVFGVLETSYGNIKELQKNLSQQLKLNGKFFPESEKKYRITCERYNFTKIRLVQISEAIDQQINLEIMNRPITQIEEINKNYLNQIENGQIFEDQYQYQLYKNLITIQESDPKSIVQDQKKYEDFRLKLDTCKNMSDADALVLQFLKINTKKTRRLIIKDLLEYRKQYQLVTPFLCRIAATLYQKYKDIADYINELLFIDYQKLKDTTLNTFVIVDKKNRNLKYICQLTKFQLIDSDKMLNCLKLLIQDLNGSNIQLLIACLESVGRFLYISKNSASKFIFLLSQLNNVLKKKSLPIMTESQITNCINLLKPSKPVLKKQKRIKTEIQKQISQIIKELDQRNIEQIVVKLQLLQKNPGSINFIIKKIVKQIPKHKFTSCYLFAIIIKRLNNEKIIKEILNITKIKIHESIQYELAQESIQWARFYGELFNYEIIEKEQLYLMLEDLLKIEQNYIGAINCICSTLQVSKMYLKGFKKNTSVNTKLRFFFKFKKYINSRKYIPMFVEFQVLDILQELQNQVLKLTNEQIDTFITQIDKMQQGRKKQLNQCQQLLKYTNNNSEFVDKLDLKENDDEQKIERPQINNHKNYDYQFQKQLNDRIENDLKNSGDRITKPKILQNFVKKKGGKLNMKSETTMNIIGRVGDKLVKKEIKKQ